MTGADFRDVSPTAQNQKSVRRRACDSMNFFGLTTVQACGVAANSLGGPATLESEKACTVAYSDTLSLMQSQEPLRSKLA